MKNKIINGEKGITLISLVVTIIILIILATVSINLALSNNGIINKATESKEKTTIESIKEKLELVKGFDYLEQEGNGNIDTYLISLNMEKIEPYVVTNKEKLTDQVGIVEVDNKYSFIITVENNKSIKVEYEGKIGEIDRENPTIEITVTGEKTQSNLPVSLIATVTSNKENITQAKWILNTSSDELGIDENVYEQETSGPITIEISDTNTYYLHTLTTDNYGRKQETIKGPIIVKDKYHTHIGSSSSKGGCYTTPIYHTHTSSCPKTAVKCRGTMYWQLNGDGVSHLKCNVCGHMAYRQGENADSEPCEVVTGYNYTCGKTNTITGYSLSCGKLTTTLEGYTIEY